MRTTEDALRSVGRHVADQLGPDWEVRLGPERGTLQYPYALVGLVGPALSARNTLHVRMTQPITIYAYPGEKETTEESLIAAERVADALWHAMVGGLRPYRIPLYDYEGLGLDKGSDVRNEHDYLALVDVQINRVLDDQDDNRSIVVCDFRAQWLRPTDRLAALRGGPVVQSIRQTIIPEGAEQSVVLSGFWIGVENGPNFGRPRASTA